MRLRNTRSWKVMIRLLLPTANYLNVSTGWLKFVWVHLQHKNVLVMQRICGSHGWWNLSYLFLRFSLFVFSKSSISNSSNNCISKSSNVFQNCILNWISYFKIKQFWFKTLFIRLIFVLKRSKLDLDRGLDPSDHDS